MAYSSQTYTYTSGDKIFPIPCPYNDADDIFVYINNVATTNFTISTNNVVVADDLTSGDKVTVKRITDKSEIDVVFSGGGLSSDDLNRVNNQLFYIMQEAIDDLGVTMGQTPDGNWEADSKKLQNLADGVASTDAATVGQIPAIAVAGVSDLQTRMTTAESDIDTLQNDKLALAGGTMTGDLSVIDATSPSHAVNLSQLEAKKLPVGTILWLISSVIPTNERLLKCNGPAISIASYTELASILYQGDTLNDTALFGYKCTDPENPSTTRSISGSYIVLPDLRGEFIRGWDDSRGVDTGRVFGSAQSQDIQHHKHAGATRQPNFAGGNGTSHITCNSDHETGDISSGASGVETRPRNIALLACIKY